MDKIKPPDKEIVRKWIRDGIVQHRRPPDPDRIRRELGWGLVDLAGRNKHGR
ncbi:MAG TPA: hypothetical protein VEC06_07165 [Paucimonas sp.]|nr:hypothetical protein [Paucimonas sp.]